MVNDSSALHIISIWLTVYAKKFENPSRVWKGYGADTKYCCDLWAHGAILTFGHGQLPTHCAHHLNVVKFLPSYLKLPPGVEVIWDGHKFMMDRQINRHPMCVWGVFLSNTWVFFFCNSCFCSQGNCKIAFSSKFHVFSSEDIFSYLLLEKTVCFPSLFLKLANSSHLEMEGHWQEWIVLCLPTCDKVTPSEACLGFEARSLCAELWCSKD